MKNQNTLLLFLGYLFLDNLLVVNCHVQHSELLGFHNVLLSAVSDVQTCISLLPLVPGYEIIQKARDTAFLILRRWDRGRERERGEG